MKKLKINIVVTVSCVSLLLAVMLTVIIHKNVFAQESWGSIVSPIFGIPNETVAQRLESREIQRKLIDYWTDSAHPEQTPTQAILDILVPVPTDREALLHMNQAVQSMYKAGLYEAPDNVLTKALSERAKLQDKINAKK